MLDTLTALEPLRPYFSFREYSVLKSTLILPFTYQSATPALLIITESSLLFAPRETLNDVFEILTTVTSSSFYVMRNERFRDLSAAPFLEQPDFDEEMRRITALAKERSWKINLFNLDLSGAVSALTRGELVVDSFRIFKEIAKVIASMLSTNGRVMILGPSQIMVILYSITNHTESILIHQFSLALKEFFQTSIPIKINILSSLPYPEEGMELSDILEKMNR